MPCPELRALEGCGLECKNDVPDLDNSPFESINVCPPIASEEIDFFEQETRSG